jgi:hypothetical protein
MTAGKPPIKSLRTPQTGDSRGPPAPASAQNARMRRPRSSSMSTMFQEILSLIARLRAAPAPA